MLPKYGFPVDVVQMTSNALANKEAKEVDLNRDLQLAIADYAPDSEVVADGNTYTSRYIKTYHSGDEWEHGYFALCPECEDRNYIKVNSEESAPENVKCVHCGAEIENDRWQPAIEPRLGFVAEFSKGTKKYTPKHGQKTEDYYIGDGSGRLIGKLEYMIGGKRVILESTANDSLVVLSRDGYRVCPFCGYAKTAPKSKNNKNGKPKKNKSKLKKHDNMYGSTCQYSGGGVSYFLSHIFKTDVVQISFMDNASGSRDIMQSVLYAVLEGLSVALDIERTDVKGCLFKKRSDDGRMLFSLVIYDTAAGGAGHVRRLAAENGKAVFRSVMSAALKHVENCSCDISCYSCLRNYNNQIIHDKLNRHDAASFLRNWQGDVEEVIPQDESTTETARIAAAPDEKFAGIAESVISKRWRQELAVSSCTEYIKLLSDNDELFPDDIGVDITDDGTGRIICTAEYIWDRSVRIALVGDTDTERKIMCERQGYEVYIIGKNTPAQLLAALKER